MTRNARPARDRQRLRAGTAAVLLMIAPVLAGCKSAAERAAEASAKAQQLASAGLYGAAQAEFDIAVQARDDLPDLWILRARNQIAMQDYAGAFASYRNALDQDRTNREALDALSQLALASNRIDDARDYAEQILALAPEDPMAQLVLATVAFRTGRYDTAAQSVAKLLAQTPDNERALVLSSRLEQRRDRFAQAIALLEPIFKAGGGSDELRQQLTQLYAQQADGPGLLSIARRDAADRAQDAVAQRSFGKQLALSGDLNEAAVAFDAAHKIAPGDASRAKTVQALADVDVDPAAIAAAVDTLSAPQPDFVVALAEYAIARGSYPVAASLLSAHPSADGATAIDRDGVLAFLAAVGGQGDDARRRADAVLAEDSGEPYALMARSLAEMAAGNGDAALRDARGVVGDNQGFAPGYAVLARILTARGDKLLAEKAYFDAVNADDDDPIALRQLVTLLLARDRGIDAQNYLRSYTMHHPDSLFGWSLRRAVCQRIGDSACAKRATTLIARLHGAKLAVPPVPDDERSGERDYRDDYASDGS
ncbi:tetratricopeptide repeat protein [Sphingomonas sp. KR1UV-12]|uniref:Tetratricopeptide repeat protein n=1 Tax=Sphingomonas aurea TaxID=3063994 RepID=A0ABT9EJK1_9SPHN|nr:tetratricopeptide repeat protein [Sphingomonas sp. KR1UV-12]MDP1027145.1 tetratricopeptide repeat protein [Sphingomonas sp. KR1UV-12]